MIKSLALLVRFLLELAALGAVAPGWVAVAFVAVVGLDSAALAVLGL